MVSITMKAQHARTKSPRRGSSHGHVAHNVGNYNLTNLVEYGPTAGNNPTLTGLNGTIAQYFAWIPCLICSWSICALSQQGYDRRPEFCVDL
jgi:hypothetical protein